MGWVEGGGGDLKWFLGGFWNGIFFYGWEIFNVSMK
jgi:hypothetical protein